MKHAIVMAVALLVACGKSGEERAKEEMAAKAAKEAESAPPVKETKPAPVVAPEAKKSEPPPAPEPTTPAEIEKAFKQAMIDGKDKDVLKYCDMMKLDDKSNPQSLMGCTLSACRIKDPETAKKY